MISLPELPFQALPAMQKTVFLIILPLLLGTSHCRWDRPGTFWEKINPFYEVEEIQDCDPVKNYFYNGQHYIERDYVKEDGTLDYKKYYESRRIQASECDPLKK